MTGRLSYIDNLRVFCFFSGYIFMFGAGIIASRQGLLEKIDFRTGKKWLWVAFGVGLPLWILFGTLGKVFEGKDAIYGGMNLPAFYMHYGNPSFVLLLLWLL